MDVKEALYATGYAYEALGHLAAPKAYAKRNQGTPEEADWFRSTLEKFIDVTRRLPDCTENAHAEAAIPHVERLLAELPPVLGNEVPRPIVEAARDILVILQFPTPDEGWDEFDPPVAAPVP